MNNKIPDRTHPAITPDHLRRRAVIYLRQSTPEQVQNHTGSAQFQRSLAEVARSYGWPDSQIQIIDEDLGKSGSSTEGRTGWQSLQAMIEANQVGSVFVANISRLSRQVLDFEFFRLRAALHNVLLFVDGRFINPADSNDAILSQVTAIVAQFENCKRAEIMMQARLAKAKRGEAVSALPVGWIKRTDGRYDYDPETKDTIQLVIKTFRETGSVYQTVKVLAEAGVKMPCKRNRRSYETKPTVLNVLTILTHPAYSGTYIFGKTRVQPGSRSPAGIRAKIIKVPEDRWVKIYNHHPPYLSREEQEEIKTILKKNRFVSRYRQARVRPLTHGLLRCAACGSRLRIYYPSKHYHFICGRANKYAEKPCLSFSGEDLEQCILRELFKVLNAPPIEMLKSALKTSRTQTQTRLSSIASERERLKGQEQAAQERVEITRGGLPSIHFDALEKLEKVLKERRQFEQKISLEPRSASDFSEEELDELCGIAREVPALWEDEAVTYDQRKEILRCLIDYIAVAATKERVDATIFWKSGANTPVYVWRTRSRSHYHLIRELHAQRLTASEIREHLAAGKTSTGQVVNISSNGLYLIMHKMGLKQHRFSLRQLSAKQKAAELYREGHSVDWIARHLEKEGFASPSGKPWSGSIVAGRLHWIREKTHLLEEIHLRLIKEALARGLDHSEIAREFNQNKIRFRGRLPWTARNLARRWNELNRAKLDRNPAQQNGGKYAGEDEAQKAVARTG